jgi:outer membrane protein TolC
MSIPIVFIRAAIAAVALAGSAPTWAVEPLTLERAQRIAAGRSLTLASQDLQARAAREMGVAAGQLPDPVLKLGINNLPISGPDKYSLTRDFMTMRGFAVMQEITRADKRKARAGRFEREAEAAQTGRLVALANLNRDTAMAWLDCLFLERMGQVLKSQRDEAGLQVEAADAAYRAARGSQADVFAARQAVAQIDDRIWQTERQLATARTRLARWVGEDASQPLGAPPDLTNVRHHSIAADGVFAQHPQIAMMLRQEQVAQAEVDIAQSNKTADWTVELMLSQRGPSFPNMVSLNVSVPLQWDQPNRQDREVAAKLAQLEQMRAQREEATREHLAETRAWLQEWHSNQERLAHYDKTLQPLAGERTRAALAAYRGGGGPLQAVLEARRMEIETRMERLRMEMETAGLWAQLESLIPTEAQASIPGGTTPPTGR